MLNADEYTTLPDHIAIIPDGNRRWAKAHGKLPWEGHYAGVDALERVAELLSGLRIKFITIWAGSYDNLTKRSPREIKVLFYIYKKYAQKLLSNKSLKKQSVRVKFFGRWKEVLPSSTQIMFEQVMSKTSLHKKKQLSILVAYNGNQEMLQAINTIASNFSQHNPGRSISESILKKHLLLGELPPVDLVFRSGGEAHFSNGFMMWHTQNSQLYFSKKFWPDVDEEEIKKALKFYSQRERRFGQ